ncbi:hypothetical protein KUTeg_021827 [Tegillarca granosa]|uniref:Integrase core domain-containing protein n=1 Tax=Tegillarca granosa TaxID=220873 RepID=A0ABQ9E4H5_TEGGR|nr:hypothetical protein KUTeg_021827 [Tegillarca granosa]
MDNELHVFALHLVYKPWIQQHLDTFRHALIRRPLRTEGNRSSLQLWIRGQNFDPICWSEWSGGNTVSTIMNIVPKIKCRSRSACVIFQNKKAMFEILKTGRWPPAAITDFLRFFFVQFTMDPGDQKIYLDEFMTWRVEALREFLTKRGLTKDGRETELAALCYSAYVMNIPAAPTSSEWPPKYFSDIIRYLADSMSAENIKCVLQDYKVGKAYEYFNNGLFHEVFLNSIFTILFAEVKLTPPMRFSDDQHRLWLCVEKTSGEIKSSYSTCTIGVGIKKERKS